MNGLDSVIPRKNPEMGCNEIQRRYPQRKRKCLVDLASQNSADCFSPKRKVRKVSPNIPKVAHIVWLNKQCSGQIPRERFINVLSLSKQLNAEGWNVKIWTNHPMILQRASVLLSGKENGKYKGLNLESHFLHDSSSSGNHGVGQTEICHDKALFPELKAVDRGFYDLKHNSYGLPNLWTPHSEGEVNVFLSDDCLDITDNTSLNVEYEYAGESDTESGYCSRRSSEKSSVPDMRVAETKSENHDPWGKLLPGVCSTVRKETLHRAFAHPGGFAEGVKSLSVEYKVTDKHPFRRNLLDFYQLQQVGMTNYSAASDYLRYAALKKYGGVYIDSDTEGAGFDDQYKPGFKPLYAPLGILVPIGWKSAHASDLVAAVPGATELERIQLDQFYHSSMSDQLPYVVRSKDENGVWRRGAVRYTESGLELSPLERGYTVSGLGDKQLVSLADTARCKGYFYQRLKGAAPTVQQGLCQEAWEQAIDENDENLRFSLTMHNPGPQVVGRMIAKMHPENYQRAEFKNLSMLKACEIKKFNPLKTLSVTKWGKLSRMNTISWDKPLQKNHQAETSSFEDSESIAIESSRHW